MQKALVPFILCILCIDVNYKKISIPGAGPASPLRISLRLGARASRPHRFPTDASAPASACGPGVDWAPYSPPARNAPYGILPEALSLSGSASQR